MTTLPETIERLGLSIRSEFVPFSQSRNKDDTHRSLNWRVTLVRRDSDILTTDYTAGIAHCPAYKLPVKDVGHINSMMRAVLIEKETETGRRANPHRPHDLSGSSIKPNDADVIYSLVTDSDVLDYRSFEQWANEYGYDSDSRNAESIYRGCLEIALQLRNGIGQHALDELRTAAQEY